MKKIAPFLFGFLIMFTLLFLVYLFGPPSAPTFSIKSGFYQKPFLLTISSHGKNETIHYTLDGSLPTLESPIYTEPILVKDASRNPNNISLIPTISYHFSEPKENIFRINTIRARSFNNITNAPSPVETHTYLVNKEIQNRYTLPIISLIVDPEDLFNQESGIYVTGEGPEVVADAGDYYYFWPANYHERGADWEKPVFVEYFDADGDLKISQNAGVRIHGGASRSYSQKSFRLYADEAYDGVEKFKYAFFPDLFDFTGQNRIDTFKTIILRNSGTDWGSSYMRDVLIQKLVQHTSVDTQATNPVIVFLNGEYWGLYFLYERYDEGYFENHYSISQENLILLENAGDVVIGTKKDEQLYQKLLEYITTHNIKNDLVYSKIKDQIDIENFIDYNIIEIFIAHRDWPENNIKFWRTRTSSNEYAVPGNDEKWRWLLFDTDHGFTYYQENLIEYLMRQDIPAVLFQNLIANPDFRIQFINRFADHLNTTFQTDRVLAEIDNIEFQLKPEMAEQINRWQSSGNSVERWQNNIALLRTFAINRPEIMTQHLIDYFALNGTYTLSLKTNLEKGYLQVNSTNILSSTPGINDPEYYQGTYFQNIPIIITAIPMEGYQFSHWSGSIVDSNQDATIEISPDTDIDIEPIFIPLDSHQP